MAIAILFAHLVEERKVSMAERNEAIAVGCYANFLIVGHNAFEFVLDFGQVYAGDTGETTHTRIVTAPVYTKAMLRTLKTAIEQFESSYGALPSADDQSE
jgi:hypothetical protein